MKLTDIEGLDQGASDNDCLGIKDHGRSYDNTKIRTHNPNDDVKVDIISDYLQGKSIALCVSGGIAAIETPKIARHLRRLGADVRAYMTTEAEKFVGVSALEWATEKDVVKNLSGRSEHIFFEDLVLIAPATTNTINKIFAGIADNAVTTLVASALGAHRPVMLAPSMHESLYNNPILQKNLSIAYKYGIKIISPRFGEHKAKISDLESITAAVSRELSSHPLKGIKVLVTAGPTPVHIDDVRIITNTFRGNLGVKIAKELYYQGADVKLLISKNSIAPPKYLDSIIFDDYDAYKANVFQELSKGYDIGIFSAAVADYQPKDRRHGKIASGGELTIEMKPTAKVIDEVREKYPELYMATFKFCIGKTQEELIEIAQNRSEKYQLVVANRGEEMVDEHAAYIVDRSGVLARPVGKENIARELVRIIGESYKK